MGKESGKENGRGMKAVGEFKKTVEFAKEMAKEWRESKIDKAKNKRVKGRDHIWNGQKKG